METETEKIETEVKVEGKTPLAPDGATSPFRGGKKSEELNSAAAGNDSPEGKAMYAAAENTSSGFALAGDRAKTPSPQGEGFEKEEDSPELQRLKSELAAVRGEVSRLEHERYLLSRGVPEEDLDYYAFKIEHMEGANDDFRKAAKEYLKAHPIRRAAVSSGAELGATASRKPATSSELMNQLLRNR